MQELNIQNLYLQKFLKNFNNLKIYLKMPIIKHRLRLVKKLKVLLVFLLSFGGE